MDANDFFRRYNVERPNLMNATEARAAREELSRNTDLVLEIMKGVKPMSAETLPVSVQKGLGIIFGKRMR